jgi:hypothetical protein
MSRLANIALTASAMLILPEAVLSCDRSFDPNTDAFTIPAILRIVGPIFVLGSTGLIILNVIVFFQRIRKLLLGVIAVVFAILVQYAAVMLVLSFDRCLDYFPVLSLVEAVVLLPLTFRHVFISAKNRPVDDLPSS